MDKIYLDDKNFLKIKIDGDTSKPKIIFSNSLGSDLSMWDPQAEFLKDDYHIVRYDKRGHGESSPIEGPYTFNMLENDVIKIMDELSIDKAHFIGLSMGGMTSIGLALKHSHRFNKLICCAARADMPPPAIEAWDQRIAVVKEKGTLGVVDGSLERWFSDEFRSNDKNIETINKASEMIQNTSTAGYIGSCEAIKKLDYLKEIGKIKNKFLFISGETDVGAPALAMEEMHHLTSGSQYKCLPKVAHVFNLENPSETNAIIQEFLG